MRNRARAAKLVGGSVASTLDVNAEENEEAMGWLAGHLVQGAGGARLGDTVEQVRVCVCVQACAHACTRPSWSTLFARTRVHTHAPVHVPARPQVLQELQRRRVRCVRIKKRSSNPHRFFSVGDDPQVRACSRAHALGAQAICACGCHAQ